jgi:hypothetical protein
LMIMRLEMIIMMMVMVMVKVIVTITRLSLVTAIIEMRHTSLLHNLLREVFFYRGLESVSS